MVNFRAGADAAKDASKSGAQFAKTHYFSLSPNPQDADNSAILRFLTDTEAWIVVDQHSNVPTKGAPADSTNWPSHMGAVCRRDRAFEGMYPDCFICDHIVDGVKVKRATARNWAYAVLREEVKENGQVVGIRDQVREVSKVGPDGKPTGETYEEKSIVVVNMGYKNFFSVLDGYAGIYHTVLDRDYMVRRNGSGTDTTYSIVPLDRIEMGDGEYLDLRMPKYAERYVPTESLEEVVTERSSDNFYGRFFDTRVTVSNSNRSQPAAAVTPPAAPAVNKDEQAALESLASRVRGYGATPAAAETPATQEAPATAVPAGGMRDFA